jgi:TAT (twin-arginine translocation) pathway signal sequence
MADETIPRRNFLKGAGAAGAAVATSLASSLAASAAAQTAPPPTSVNPATRPADLVLKNGKVITVDAAFTIAEAIAIAGDRIVGVGSDAYTLPLDVSARSATSRLGLPSSPAKPSQASGS